MLIDRADLDDLAAHRQRCWERQRQHVVEASLLHRRAWGGAVAPRSLAALGELPLDDKEILRDSQRALAVRRLPCQYTNKSGARAPKARRDA